MAGADRHVNPWLVAVSVMFLQAGYWDVFWPQLVQGAGLSLLFVPLTTVAMDSIARERMGNATSLFNLMRNLGGSIGIAVTATMVSRGQQTTSALMSSHVTPYDAESQAMFTALRASFMAAGADTVTATNQALAAMAGLVQRQAAMVSFVGLFELLAIMFIVLVPLVLLMKRPRSGAVSPGGH